MGNDHVVPTKWYDLVIVKGYTKDQIDKEDKDLVEYYGDLEELYRSHYVPS